MAGGRNRLLKLKFVVMQVEEEQMRGRERKLGKPSRKQNTYSAPDLNSKMSSFKKFEVDVLKMENFRISSTDNTIIPLIFLIFYYNTL
jgi:hypothetical protein